MGERNNGTGGGFPFNLWGAGAAIAGAGGLFLYLRFHLDSSQKFTFGDNANYTVGNNNNN